MNFDDYWDTVQLGPSVGPPLAAMSADDRARLQSRMLELVPVAADGRLIFSARAHAVKGQSSQR